MPPKTCGSAPSGSRFYQAPAAIGWSISRPDLGGAGCASTRKAWCGRQAGGRHIRAATVAVPRAGRVLEAGGVQLEDLSQRVTLTPEQVSSPLACLPYDLRHVCVSFWLSSRVSLAETARRAGQSIAMLQRYYAKVLDGQEERMNELLDRGFAEHEEDENRTS